MTKEEVRAISLDKLELHRAKRMLDVAVSRFRQPEPIQNWKW